MFLCVLWYPRMDSRKGAYLFPLFSPFAVNVTIKQCLMVPAWVLCLLPVVLLCELPCKQHVPHGRGKARWADSPVCVRLQV